MKFVVVEDDQTNIDTFTSFFNKYSLEKQKQISLQTFINPLRFLAAFDNKFDFDVLFVDINMPQIDGMEICKRVREVNKDVIIVIVSAFSAYAIDGYVYNVMDFVLKPYTYSALSRTFDRVIEKVESSIKKDIYIKIGTTIKCLKSKDIYYIEAQGHTMVWHTVEGKIEGSGSLMILEEELKKFNFSRCSNSFLINLDQVSTIKNNYIFFADGQVNITRSYRESFMKDLEAYLGKL